MLDYFDKNKIEELILKEYESMYRLAYSYVRNKDDALDVVQESIYKALKNKDKLKNPVGIRSWLLTITVHTAIDSIRRRKREVPCEDTVREDFVDDIYEDTDLLKALDKLTEKEKTIITLRFFEDLKVKDIAAALPMEEKEVKNTLYGAIKKLRKIMN